MSLNSTPPYLLYNVYNQKDREVYKQIVPQLKRRLEQKFQTEFAIDDDFVINYDSSKATKEEVMKVNNQVFKDYYKNR